MSAGGSYDGLATVVIIVFAVVEVVLFGIAGLLAWLAYVKGSILYASGALGSLAAALYLPLKGRGVL
jgi:hypothetical protein